MGLTMPNSMDECIYFSNRTLEDGKGKALAWVYRKECPKCHKAKMGKPVGPEGKVKIRADEYQCPECNYIEQKTEHEESLTLEVMYTCPACGKQGEGTTIYKRVSFLGVKAYVLECEHCGHKIGITKKMKKPKK